MSSLANYFSVLNNLPEQIKTQLKVIHIVNNNIGYCVTQNDKVYGLGDNINQHLGYSETYDNNSCVLVQELCDKQIEEFFDGNNFMFALSLTKEVYSWGHTELGQTGLGLFSGNILKPTKNTDFEGKNIIQISCGHSHGLALSSDGMAYGWGDNRKRQLRPEEPNIKGMAPRLMEKIDERIKSVHCCNNMSFALTYYGSVYIYNENKLMNTWINSEGTIVDLAFDEMFTKIVSPILLIKSNKLPKPRPHITLKSEFNLNEYFIPRYGKTHKTIRFNENNEMFSYDFQFNYDTNEVTKTLKQIGVNQSKSVSVSSDLGQIFRSRVRCFYKSHKSELFVMDDDMVFSIGDEYNWVEIKSGLGKILKLRDMLTIPELCGKQIEEFYESSNCLFARSESNVIYSWGQNVDGQLGRDILNNEYYKPSMIEGPFVGKKIIQICCGSSHCLALSSDAVVYGWGDNSQGQVGCELKGVITSPLEVQLDQIGNEIRIIFIECYKLTSFAVDTEGSVNYWGQTFYWGNRVQAKPTKMNLVDVVKIKKFNDFSDCIILSKSGNIFIYCFGDKTIKKDISIKYQIITDILPDICSTDMNNPLLLFKTKQCLYKYDCVKGVTERSNFVNFYDYFTEEYNLTHKTIQIFEEKDKQKGKYLTTKEIQLINKRNRKRVPNSNQEILKLEDINVFVNKFSHYFHNPKDIGTGTFGNVIQVKSRLDGELFALKIIDLRDKKYYNLDEIKIMSKLNSNFVVKYWSSWIEKNNQFGDKVLFIQMELCSQNLREIINLMNKFDDKRVKIFRYFISCQIFRELTKGVNYLHTLNPPIIHRDLKPENVVTTDGKHGIFLKLVDFNISKVLGVEKMLDDFESKNDVEMVQLTRRVGTAYYMAPEVNSSNCYDSKSDIYSMGIIATEIFGFKDNVRKITELLNDNKLDLNQYLEEYVGTSFENNFRELIQTINACLVTKDPNLRPDCQQLQQSCAKFSVDKELLKEDKSIYEKVVNVLKTKEYRFLCNLFFHHIGGRPFNLDIDDMYSGVFVVWGAWQPK